MDIYPQTLTLLPDTFAICRFEVGTGLPTWLRTDRFFSFTNTDDEVSLACVNEGIPSQVKADRGWRCFKLQGPFPFDLTGILNSVTVPLADAKIGIFAVSTYDTDHVLVKEENLERAIAVLREKGHIIHIR